VVTPRPPWMTSPPSSNSTARIHPNNYGERFNGKVTVRQALTNSLNVATVKVAELVGYGRVVQIARQMGLPSQHPATRQ